MSGPQLSVVVPCFRRGQKVARTVESLLTQSLPPEAYEVILVDNDSGDGTLAVLRQAAARHPGRVRAYAQPQPGAGAARNLGVAQARGELILFLDDDMCADPRLLETHLAAHRDFEGSVLGFLETDWGSGRNRFLEFLRRSEMQNDFPFADGELVSYRYFYTGNVSVRREAFERVGGFDEGFRIYGVEDIDLGYRLEMSGEPLRFARGALAFHDYQPDLAQFTAKRMAAGRSLAYFLGKYPHLRKHFDFGPQPWLRLTFWYVAFRLARLALFAVAGTGPLTKAQYHYFYRTVRWHMYRCYAVARARHLWSRLSRMGSYLN